MSTTPPEQPGTRPAYGYNAPNMARMPMPGNAEFLVYLAVEILLAILWWAAKAITIGTWYQATIILTFGYILSRGIAKAGKVLEQ
jgi:hypothetical protein